MAKEVFPKSQLVNNRTKAQSLLFSTFITAAPVPQSEAARAKGTGLPMLGALC